MGLLPSQRRWLLAPLLAILCAPGLAMLVTPYRTVSAYENRPLAPPPKPPRDRPGLAAFPRQVDAFFKDHFGLREPMLRAGRALTWRLGGRASPPGAVEGRGGWLFLTEGLLRATGYELQPQRARDFSAFLCEASRRLQAQGAVVAFASPPASASVYPEHAPEWATPRRPTEYDLVLRDVRACALPAVDLRQALIAEKRRGRLYWKADSHWTPLGSLLAYNHVVAAIGRPEWRHLPERLSWGRRETDGDLPRLAGLPPRRESAPQHSLDALPPRVSRTLAPEFGQPGEDLTPAVYDMGREGPTVVIVGDSFTYRLLPPLFAPFAGKVVALNMLDCRFDWRVMRRYRPDYVLFMPTERELDCDGRPKF